MIRQKFLQFFEGKGHKKVDSSSLIPKDDSSVLFTTAGMQQFKPYYLNKKDALKDFGSKNVVSIQKCVRTSDIDEVGDERHLTFFEMLGNFSFGGYWKEEAIKYAHEFITSSEWMNLKIDYVTVFEGQDNVPADTESESIWRSIDPNLQIRKAGRADNFWGPTGIEGPCGPTTEIYVDGIEIWNVVFNEFYQNADKSLRPLETKGIDTGMGLERLAKVAQKVETVFETDLFNQIIKYVNICSSGNKVDYSEYLKKARRIVADHLRSAVFIIGDGILPDSNERGYIPRKLLKNAYVYGGTLNLINNGIETIAQSVITSYIKTYPDLNSNRDKIIGVIKTEITRLMELDKSSDLKLEKEFDSYMQHLGKSGMSVQISKPGVPYAPSHPFISPEQAFDLYSTYGIPKEKIIKFLNQKNFITDLDKFDELFEIRMKKHQEVSRAGMEQKFKGGLAGHGEMELRYHTATHLLHQALHDVLGDKVEQKGSNITPERLRFDFSHPQKMTDEQKKQVEDIVNEKISAALPMNNVVMPKAKAEKTGARHFFGEKYGEEISIYYIGNDLASAYSKEFCGGPHVKNTSELAGPEGNWKFKIQKEEAVSQGVRRIKAVLV